MASQFRPDAAFSSESCDIPYVQRISVAPIIESCDIPVSPQLLINIDPSEAPAYGCPALSNAILHADAAINSSGCSVAARQPAAIYSQCAKLRSTVR